MDVSIGDEVSIVVSVAGAPSGGTHGVVVDTSDTSAYVKWNDSKSTQWISMRFLRIEKEAEIDPNRLVEALDLLVSGAVKASKGLEKMSKASKRLSIHIGAMADKHRDK